MAQRYIMALDYADQNAKRVLKKHARKRPLGEIESKHHYTPPQPVLSCRTVDIDVSGTRTYRPRSTTDILQEQHKLIHNIYRKQRNITSAPPRSVRTPVVNRNTDNDFQAHQRINIQVNGRPLTSQSHLPANQNTSPRPAVRRRPNSTGNIKQISKKNYMVLRADPDLLETSQSNKELTRVIHEQWLPEKHSLNQGIFQRGQSKADIPPGLDTWLTFGGAQTEESSGIIDAFAKFKENAEFYTIEGNVGSCVAQRLQTGDKIRIGINGRLQSENLKVKKWIKEKQDNQPIEEKAEKENMEKRVIPLCWDDEINGIKTKCLSPRSRKDGGPKPSLCETHPVLFRNHEEEEKQRPKIMSRQEGFKVKHRPKSGASLDGQEKENKIVVITIDRKSEEEENKLNGISVDDVLKSSLSAKNSKKSDNVVHENEDEEIKDKTDIEEAELPLDQDLHIDNLRSASKISMTESQISVTSDRSRTPKFKPVTPNFPRQSTTDLSVGPVSGSTARIDSAKSNRSGSEKSSASSRIGSDRLSGRQTKKQVQPKPVFRSVTMSPFSPSYGTDGETEYIQITQQLRNPKPQPKQDLRITQSVSDEAIRQVGRKNKIGSADSRKRAPPTTPVIPVETPRETLNEDEPEDIRDSPIPSPTIKPSTPTVSISIPTAESFQERDSASNSPWPSHGANLDSDEVLSKQQKRELSMRDSQIDHLTSLLGDAIIASEQLSEREIGTPEKTVTFKEGS